MTRKSHAYNHYAKGGLLSRHTCHECIVYTIGSGSKLGKIVINTSHTLLQIGNMLGLYWPTVYIALVN